MLELKARNEPAHKLEKYVFSGPPLSPVSDACARDLEKAAGKASERRSSQKRSMQDKAKMLKKKQEDSDAQVWSTCNTVLRIILTFLPLGRSC